MADSTVDELKAAYEKSLSFFKRFVWASVAAAALAGFLLGHAHILF